ncbi:MAG: AMP-binding protein, partial [Erythrobacter sp.]|nr:AMP-binding protein [Erythrobacter sp.]
MANNAYHDFVTFDEILDFWATERPDGLAFEQEGRIATYGELDDITRRLIGLYQSKGIVKGDRIAWLGKNEDIYCQLYLAAARMGAVMVPVGWRLAPPEVAYILSDTDAKLVFAGEEFVETAREIAADLSARPEVVSADQARAFARSHDHREYASPDADEPILQLYTSGTTGNPKGAVLSNANLLGLRNHGNAAGLAWNFFDPDDCMLIAMPCAHIGGTGLIN